MWTVVGVAATATAAVRPARGSPLRRRLQHHAAARAGPSRARSARSSGCRTSRARIAAETGCRVLVLLLAVGAAAWSAAALVAPDRLVLGCRATPPGVRPCFEVARRSQPGLRSASSPLRCAVAARRRRRSSPSVVAPAPRRRLPDRPEQPARHLVGLATARRRRVSRCGSCLVVAAALGGGDGGVGLRRSPRVAGPAVPAASSRRPSSCRRRARTAPDAAFVDLRHVAWTGRPVEVDRYDTELVPAAGPGEPMTIDPRFERSVHRWLRAYPRRWRPRSEPTR